MLDQNTRSADRHEARFTYQRGEWRATCETCGWTVMGDDRRELRSQYVSQHQEFRQQQVDEEDPFNLL